MIYSLIVDCCLYCDVFKMSFVDVLYQYVCNNMYVEGILCQEWIFVCICKFVF